MRMLSRVRRGLNRLRFGPRIATRFGGTLVRLGSEYGGWVFADTGDLEGATIVACGLGEDASFDTEFAARFGARMVMVDPTPRAIAHYEAMLFRVGLPREREYAAGGSQPPAAYELARVSSDQLLLIPKAVTDSVGTVRFFAPTNPSDVSHSVVNFQNDYSDSTPFIEVESIDFDGVLAAAGVTSVALVKFDIEGAEIAVIPQMIQAGVKPRQILVEFDELNRPSRRARRNFDSVHGLLLDEGYLPIDFDGRSCVSYLRAAAP
jgi:FkbM family methyltransferase